MPVPTTSPPREFLVQGEDVASEPFAAHVENDPDVRTLDRIARDAVVLSLSADATARLRARFGPALRIEPNTNLTPPL